VLCCSIVAPPVGHPLLGLGGRSIELSLAQGEPVSPDAVALAVQALCDASDTQGESVPEWKVDVRRAASFLLDAARDVQISPRVRHDLEAVARAALDD
jgi:hypothetical protein